jgi:hypothetical protein
LFLDELVAAYIIVLIREAMGRSARLYSKRAVHVPGRQDNHAVRLSLTIWAFEWTLGRREIEGKWLHFSEKATYTWTISATAGLGGNDRKEGLCANI